jgi:hypothetical protein
MKNRTMKSLLTLALGAILYLALSLAFVSCGDLEGEGMFSEGKYIPEDGGTNNPGEDTPTPTGSPGVLTLSGSIPNQQSQVYIFSSGYSVSTATNAKLYVDNGSYVASGTKLSNSATVSLSWYPSGSGKSGTFNDSYSNSGVNYKVVLRYTSGDYQYYYSTDSSYGFTNGRQTVYLYSRGPVDIDGGDVVPGGDTWTPGYPTTTLSVDNNYHPYSISSSGETAWYSFTVQTEYTYAVYLDDGFGGSGSYTGDVEIRGFSSNGGVTVFEETDAAYTTPETFYGLNGTVYLRIQAWDNSSNDDTSIEGSAGSYTGSYAIRVQRY